MPKFIEEGIVLSTQGKTAVVKITPKGSCPDSHAGCPAKVLAEEREFTAKSENPINAQPGQKVLVEMTSLHFYKGLMLVFILPLILLFMGYIVGILIAKLINKQEEPFGYIFMGVGFILSFFLMARFGKNCSPTYKIIKLAG